MARGSDVCRSAPGAGRYGGVRRRDEKDRRRRSGQRAYNAGMQPPVLTLDPHPAMDGRPSGTVVRAWRRAGTSRSVAVAALVGLAAAAAGCPSPPAAGSDAGPTPTDGSSADLASSAAAPLCSVDGWCWRNPLPQGNPLHAVYASAADRFWVAGDRGAIFRYDGAGWVVQSSGTSATLNSLWGTDSNNIWAVGTGGTIVRWNGSAWSQIGRASCRERVSSPV